MDKVFFKKSYDAPRPKTLKVTSQTRKVYRQRHTIIHPIKDGHIKTKNILFTDGEGQHIKEDII